MAVAKYFTKAALLALPLPLPGKRAYYRDPKTRSLHFVVTDSGTRSFVFYRKVNGRPERVLLGRFDELSIEQARDRAAELNGRVAQGWDPRKERQQEKLELTLGQLFAEFLSRYGRANLRHAEEYENKFRRYFCTTRHGGMNLENVKVRDVTRAEIARVFGNVTSKGMPITANRVLALVSSVFGWAVRAGLIEANPAHGIRKNSERQFARDRFLQPHEMPAFFKAVAADESDVMRDYVLLSLLTGQRQANILRMKWSEIDFDNKVWRIPRTSTKTGREYVVPLIQQALDILDARKQQGSPSAYVLDGSGDSGHMSEPKKGWRRVLVRAELFQLLEALREPLGLSQERIAEAHAWNWWDIRRGLAAYQRDARELGIDPTRFSMSDLRMHDLRRTLASWQATTGANLVAISKTLNHSNVSTTSIYARLQVDPVRDAIRVASDAMFAAAQRAPSSAVVPFARGAAAGQ